MPKTLPWSWRCYGRFSSRPAYCKKTKEQLDTLELLPFYRLVDQADSIMTAHLLIPALDSQNCATLSKNILTDLLREERGFQGLLFLIPWLCKDY